MIEIYERKITSWVRFSLNQILKTGYYIYIHTGNSLFRKKRLMLDENLQPNASKLAIFYIGILKPNVDFSVFNFVLLYIFSLMNAPVYVDIHQGIH